MPARIRKPWILIVLAMAVVCVLVVPRQIKRWARESRAASAPELAVMIHVADPRSFTRLVRGFYATDNDLWRWTGREFSIILNPPKNAYQNGAVLVLRYAIVEAVLANVKTMNLSISVDGVALPVQHYDKPGQFILRLDTPANALRFDPVRVDFTLDKALPPSGREVRELGIIVSDVGFEPR